MNNALTEQLNKEFEKTIKIGLVSTIDENNSPHITVLSSIMGKGTSQMILGKFIEGYSKEFFQKRPKSSFLIMNTNKEFWIGKMNYNHESKEGEDYINYNNQPLFRYNSYFGINTVYYFDLVKISDKLVLPMTKVIYNAILSKLFKSKYKGDRLKKAMNDWTYHFLSKMDTLTFISYIDEDGYPKIVPVISAQSASSSRIVFRNQPFREMLLPIKKGQDIAILGFSMTMETVLVKGMFSGFDKMGLGYLDITRIYNSMPPVHKYIYEEKVKHE
ncbi:MAG: hypothetical protein KJ971_04945 [Firmicutes bacterium]|nr:hypothetical protein [Bacillota bacterium]